MSICVIIGREVAQAVTYCLHKIYKTESPVWIAEQGQGPAMLEDAARVPADLLILDVETGPGLGPAVLRYRLARPLTRIILLAQGKLPGDIEVAGVVQAGVYDVVTDLDELENVLDLPQAGLDMAVLWLDPSLATGASSRTQIQERVVERRVAVSQRPVLIAVAGAASGVGTTTVACTLAGYLARYGYRTVLSETGQQPSLAIITEKNLNEQPVQWLPNLDVCIEPMPRNLVRVRQHAYVVADLGAYSCEQLSETDADLSVVVLPQVHRIMRAITWLREGKQKQVGLKGLRYAVTGEKKTTGQVVSMWKNICSELIPGMETMPMAVYLPFGEGEWQEWPPGYGRGSEKMERACRELLADVLPDVSVETKRGWFPFGRKKPRVDRGQ